MIQRFCSYAFAGALLAAGPPLFAQNIPGSGWSSFGVLPFRGYDFRLMKAPTQYVMYFNHHADTGTYEGPDVPKGRAFSPDLKTWTLDTRDVCSTSGDYCTDGNSAGALTLPDGRIRMFFGTGAGGMVSATSADGITWTRDAGVRLVPDPTSIYERGNFALDLASFVTLPDGSFRMYYEGGVTNGSPGTPAYYNSIFYNGMILSAVSKDGLNWVRETGVRVNPLVQGPANTLGTPGGTTTSQFHGADVSAVAVRENGQTVYRLYLPTLSNGPASYVSSDGLTFVLEGNVPAMAGDPKAYVMPDGRTWLITNQYPDALADILVYGPQTFYVPSVRAAVGAQPASGFASPFKSVMMGISGTASGPVTLSAPVGEASNCPGQPCSFHPEYYSFSPATGTPPFSTVVTYTGPPTYNDHALVIHAQSADATAAGSIDCMALRLGIPGNEVFCSGSTVALPMNKMTFALATGGTASSQTSNILTLGGTGYPFKVTSSVPWVMVSPSTGVAPTPLQVTVDPTGLAAGSYTGVLTTSAEGTAETITVNATISAGPAIAAVQNAGAPGSGLAPNGFLTLYGSGLANSTATWSPATSLPSSLAGTSVKINGKEAFISYASPGQLNVLPAPDAAPGPASVTVTTAAGTATASVTLEPSGPAWFAYNVKGPNWLAALFGNTATYVAPAGSLGPSLASRPAKAGDFLQLYANGLGTTNPVAPVGAVVTVPYPLDDFARVKVTIAGQPVQVLWAGLVAAGLYQVNVQVPPGLGVGELPVVMAVDGRTTQLGITLNFQ